MTVSGLLRTLPLHALLVAFVLAAVPAAAFAQAAESPPAVEENLLEGLDLTEGVVEVPPEKSRWITIGGPIALAGLAVFILLLFKWLVPFRVSEESLNLHHYPTGVKRGLAMTVVFFGIAFCFGASEIWYQLQLHGSTEEYFRQMSLGKLIAFTHAHLFGFTTSFLIIGVPFSMQFNHIPIYQWIFPVGLTASIIDVMSWWGIKYLSPNFEIITMACGIVFSLSYLYMLLGILRVLLLPDVVLPSDKDAAERTEAIRKRRRLRDLLRRESQEVHPE
jgi:hypothetical protein